MPEAICVIGNLKKHMRFIAKSVSSLREDIREDPSVLCIGSESASIQDLCHEIDLSMKGLDEFAIEARNVQELVVQVY